MEEEPAGAVAEGAVGGREQHGDAASSQEPEVIEVTSDAEGGEEVPVTAPPAAAAATASTVLRSTAASRAAAGSAAGSAATAISFVVHFKARPYSMRHAC